MPRARVVLRDTKLATKAVVDNLLLFDCSRAENTAGAFSCTLPMQSDYESIGPDWTLELQRSFDGGNTWRNDLETLWFVRSITVDYANNGHETIQLSGHDLLGLLDRRLVAYFSVQNTDLEQNYYTIKNKPVDDILREIVRENCTDAILAVLPADLPGSVSVTGAAKRILPYVTVEENTSKGPVVQSEFAWSGVLEALRKTADAAIEEDTRVVFDLIYRPSIPDFHFQVWQTRRGTDRSRRVVFSLEEGNLESVRMIKDYTTEMTWAHIGGEGQASQRLITTLTLPDTFQRTPWYPTELFVDASGDKNDEALMNVRAARELRRAAPRWIFSADALDTPTMRFGREYQFGDTVGIRYRGQRSTCRIKSVRFHYENGGIEQVTIPLESEEIL